MGITKSDLFTAQQNELSQLAKAMGHPARIAILQYLLASSRTEGNRTDQRNCGRSVCELLHQFRKMGISQIFVQWTIRSAYNSMC